RQGSDSLAPMMREKFPGCLIANEALDLEKAADWLARGRADAAAFGRLFIANPDLPVRFAQGAPLNAPQPETFYAPGPEGYTDYPALEGCRADA
ncbi:MAG: alkene reductase, partial [Castellaniella sp.]